MKKFDRYSIRGLIMSMISAAGMVYELFFSIKIDALVVVLYGLVFIFGLFLLLMIRDKNP